MRRFILISFCIALVWILLSGCGDNNIPSTSATYTVSGQINRQDNGLSLEGVTLNFSNGQSVTTGPDGSWSQSGFSGTVTVTPSRDGWAFEPQNRQLIGGGINANFTAKNASNTTYTVSGKITNQSGNGLGDVVLTFSSGFGTATTGSDGAWSKDGLWGRMSVTPAKIAWTFTPTNQDLTGQAGDIDFSGTPLPVLADTPWPKFRGNMKNTGQSQYLGTQTNTLKWSRVTDECLSSPTIGLDGTIYVGSGNNKLYAISPNGILKWSYTTGSFVESSPAIDSDGTIYVGSGGLYALNSNGALKWEYYTDGTIESSPAIGPDGIIYVGSSDKKLYAINSNGTLKWSYATGNAIYSSCPAIGTDGTIYVGSWDHKLYAVNSNGALKWSFTTGYNISSSPAIGPDGTIYVGSGDGKLYAVNSNGTLKWSYTTGDDITSSPAISTDGTIYVGSWDGKLYAFNPNGVLKWSYTTGSYVESSPAIGMDGTIYFGSNDYKVYAINSNGDLKWSIGYWIYSSPAIGSDGTVYVGSIDHRLYAIGSK